MNKQMIASLFIWFICVHPCFSQTETGIASFYGDEFEGRSTANGEIYKHNQLTAAHKTLPFNTIVRVVNPENNKEVIVRINDRGPFTPGRLIDLSKSAAEILGFIPKGLTEVKVEVIGGTVGGNSGGGNSTSTPKEFYSVTAKKASPVGYGVQISSYKELANLIRLVENLEDKYKEKVTVQVSKVNNEKVYRIILGEYTNRPDAEKVLEKVKEEFKDGFVVSFERL